MTDEYIVLCRVGPCAESGPPDSSRPNPHYASLLQGVPQKCAMACLHFRHFWGASLRGPKSIQGAVGSVSLRFSSSSSPFLDVVVPANPPRIKTRRILQLLL